MPKCDFSKVAKQIHDMLIIDTENIFHTVNRETMPHNISVMWSTRSTYISNCHNTPARLFIIGGIEVLYKEGTTQRYPIAMATYPLGVTQLIQHLLEMTPFNKQLASK